ncbi:type IV pilin [Halegenticoccus soli]|uniref:type IV pilin n=1 Tax=Halegenticoccus soli TaxID=1985678 RepID=UPI000C6D06BA|nr:type IV pilin N-terminal domain-containing protein [Halegenticoccus soli]
MQLRKLLTENRAVSPVIGVILMVAITVILAAVIGTFVLGLGDQVQQTAPQASFSFDFHDGNQVTITHDGGDAIEEGNDLTTVSSGSFSGSDDWADSYGTSKVTAGDSITRTHDTSWDGETLRVVWNRGNDNSATLAKATAPSA